MAASNLSRLPLLLRNDHRAIGIRQNLFVFHETSQGSCFFLPRGARIYNKLIDFLRQEYKKYKYEEIITPNLFKTDLWRQSGHWEHYKDGMLKFESPDDQRDMSLKPMNCPGHCVLFKQLRPIRTLRQLPVRWAEFGVLHRDELSGSIKGLTRLRRFQQDDAHIFCAPQQVEQEVRSCLDFAVSVYQKFGFNFKLNLSLRPKTYLGESSLWDRAETSLRAALRLADLPFSEQKFEGAFYGPKIDLEIEDCKGKINQCATIQLDFQLPERFELEYEDTEDPRVSEGIIRRRPVIIHRAILGSVERFMAMLAENCSGRWPFWLSPVQARVIPTHSNLNHYAESVAYQLRDRGLWIDCDTRESMTLKAKIRDAHLIPYNLILVVGEKEFNTNSVSCRIHMNKQLQQQQMKSLEETKSKSDESRSEQSQMDSSYSSEQHKSVTRNVSFSTDEFADRLVEFERQMVSDAQIELLTEFDSKTSR